MALKNGLPVSVVSVFTDPEWSGGPNLQVASEVARPSSDDCLVNYYFLRPFVARFSDSIPSGFFCSDVFLYTDRLFNGNFLKSPDETQSKKTMACMEGSKLKRLMGALRFLWRSSALRDAVLQ